LHRKQRGEPALDLGLHKQLEPLPHPFARLTVKKFSGLHLGPRRQDCLAGRESPDRTAPPLQPP